MPRQQPPGLEGPPPASRAGVRAHLSLPGCWPGPGRGRGAGPGVGGVIQCQTRSQGGPVKPQDSRARCAWPGPSSGLCRLGPGCGPWRRLGPEPQYFKPLVPMQLPNLLSVQAAATPGVHTGTHMPDTRAHAQAHVHTVGQVFPARAVGHLHLASCGFRLGGGSKHWTAGAGNQASSSSLGCTPPPAPVPPDAVGITWVPAASPEPFRLLCSWSRGGWRAGRGPRDSFAFSGFFKLGTCRVGRARLPGARGGCFWSL